MSYLSNLSKQWKLGFLVLIGLVVLNIVLYQQFLGKEQHQYVFADMVVDTSDQKKLAGISENIFVGKVVEQKGNKRLSEVPETQYTVEVVDNLKGKLNGIITVNQQGGYNDKKELVLIEGDNLLEPNQTYLFSTRYLPSENWHTVIPVHGKILLDSPITITTQVSKMRDSLQNAEPFVIK